jgi:hypothetical protein
MVYAWDGLRFVRVERNDGYHALVRDVCRADGGRWVLTASLKLVGVDGKTMGGPVPLTEGK